MTIRAGAGLMALATLWGVAGAAFAGAPDLYYERAFMAAADDRCRLFPAATGHALDSAAAQARGAALRGGVERDALAAIRSRALSRAATTACDHPDLTLAANRVRQAFEGWSRTAQMTFPGDQADWSADRTAFARPTWRLVQRSAYRDAPISVGHAAGPGLAPGLMAVVSFPGRPRPYAARIVLRDPATADRPWIVRAGFGAALPPPRARRAFYASGRILAPEQMREDGRRSGLAWRFPDAAAQAIAQLDPRERFVVEFLFHDDSTAHASFEVGDFAAGQAFLAMGER